MEKKHKNKVEKRLSLTLATATCSSITFNGSTRLKEAGPRTYILGGEVSRHEIYGLSLGVHRGLPNSPQGNLLALLGIARSRRSQCLYLGGWGQRPRSCLAPPHRASTCAYLRRGGSRTRQEVFGRVMPTLAPVKKGVVPLGSAFHSQPLSPALSPTHSPVLALHKAKDIQVRTK
ncbi:hypothetical protein Cgig2_030555 [Carnegiea gigantea]|uniref:Uncharacterized protein n=1 Tax=Carnegiea gigantea TaxID=171969 RepID=A0A9Q1JMF3_9CARY|nr:hypothetical protein Cgig2_030555 [Carnegiea gigantea]